MGSRQTRTNAASPMQMDVSASALLTSAKFNDDSSNSDDDTSSKSSSSSNSNSILPHNSAVKIPIRRGRPSKSATHVVEKKRKTVEHRASSSDIIRIESDSKLQSPKKVNVSTIGRSTRGTDPSRGGRTLRSREKLPKLEQKKLEFKCTQCKKAFPTKGSVNRHIRWCTPKKPKKPASKTHVGSSAVSYVGKAESPTKFGVKRGRPPKIIPTSESRDETKVAIELSGPSTSTPPDDALFIVTSSSTNGETPPHAQSSVSDAPSLLSLCGEVDLNDYAENTPVRCTICKNTYRTGISYRKHLSNCTHYSSSSGEEEVREEALMAVREAPTHATEYISYSQSNTNASFNHNEVCLSNSKNAVLSDDSSSTSATSSDDDDETDKVPDTQIVILNQIDQNVQPVLSQNETSIASVDHEVDPDPDRTSLTSAQNAHTSLNPSESSIYCPSSDSMLSNFNELRNTQSPEAISETGVENLIEISECEETEVSSIDIRTSTRHEVNLHSKPVQVEHLNPEILAIVGTSFQGENCQATPNTIHLQNTQNSFDVEPSQVQESFMQLQKNKGFTIQIKEHIPQVPENIQNFVPPVQDTSTNAFISSKTEVPTPMKPENETSVDLYNSNDAQFVHNKWNSNVHNLSHQRGDIVTSKPEYTFQNLTSEQHRTLTQQQFQTVTLQDSGGQIITLQIPLHALQLTHNNTMKQFQCGSPQSSTQASVDQYSQFQQMQFPQLEQQQIRATTIEQQTQHAPVLQHHQHLQRKEFFQNANELQSLENDLLVREQESNFQHRQPAIQVQDQAALHHRSALDQQQQSESIQHQCQSATSQQIQEFSVQQQQKASIEQLSHAWMEQLQSALHQSRQIEPRQALCHSAMDVPHISYHQQSYNSDFQEPRAIIQRDQFQELHQMQQSEVHLQQPANQQHIAFQQKQQAELEHRQVAIQQQGQAALQQEQQEVVLQHLQQEQTELRQQQQQQAAIHQQQQQQTAIHQQQQQQAALHQQQQQAALHQQQQQQAAFHQQEHQAALHHEQQQTAFHQQQHQAELRQQQEQTALHQQQQQAALHQQQQQATLHQQQQQAALQHQQKQQQMAVLQYQQQEAALQHQQQHQAALQHHQRQEAALQHQQQHQAALHSQVVIHQKEDSELNFQQMLNCRTQQDRSASSLYEDLGHRDADNGLPRSDILENNVTYVVVQQGNNMSTLPVSYGRNSSGLPFQLGIEHKHQQSHPATHHLDTRHIPNVAPIATSNHCRFQHSQPQTVLPVPLNQFQTQCLRRSTAQMPVLGSLTNSTASSASPARPCPCPDCHQRISHGSAGVLEKPKINPITRKFSKQLGYSSWEQCQPASSANISSKRTKSLKIRSQLASIVGERQGQGLLLYKTMTSPASGPLPRLLPATVATTTVASLNMPNTTFAISNSNLNAPTTTDSLLLPITTPTPVPEKVIIPNPNIAVVHPLQKMSDQILQMESTFSITPNVPNLIPENWIHPNDSNSPGISSAKLAQQLAEIQATLPPPARSELRTPLTETVSEFFYTGIPVDPRLSQGLNLLGTTSVTQQEMTNLNTEVGVPNPGQIVNPPIPVPPERGTNPKPQSQKSIKVTLKRQEGADSYSLLNVSETGNQAPGTMRSLKIKGKITSGEHAGSTTDVVVLPIVHTIPIPDPDVQESNRTIVEEDSGRAGFEGAAVLPSSSNTMRLTHRAVIVYEVRLNDTVVFRSSDVRSVWANIFETVQGRRLDHNLPPLSYPATNISLPENKKDAAASFNQLGLTHRAVQFLLQQLPGINKAAKEKRVFKFHKPLTTSVEGSGSEDSAESTDCARSRSYTGRKPFDMFGWLASKHRKPLVHTNKRTMETSKSTELPLAMKFRNLHKNKSEHLVVYCSSIHGRGLFTTKNIECGDMIIEYAGEIIRSGVCDVRDKFYESKGIGCYMFRIDDHYVVDATLKGNAARFINHSCNPNCHSKIMEISGKKHIVIIAVRRIQSGEELTYDYKFPYEDEKIPCMCDTPKCRKFLN